MGLVDSRRGRVAWASAIVAAAMMPAAARGGGEEAWFQPGSLEKQRQYERALDSLVTAEAVAARGELFATVGGSEPAAARAFLAGLFGTFGLKVEEEHPAVDAESGVLAALLPGSRLPHQEIVVGCRAAPDAAGAACIRVLADAGRVLAELARRGARPSRTIRLALWPPTGAAAWVGAHEPDLRQDGIAYVDIRGPDAATGAVAAVRVSPSLASLAVSLEGGATRPADVTLFGVGGDIASFATRAGLPVAVVQLAGAGPDELAAAIRRVTLLAVRLTAADLLPLDPRGDVAALLRGLRATGHSPETEVAQALRRQSLSLQRAAEETAADLERAVASGSLTLEAADAASWELGQLARLWLDPRASPGESRHLLLADREGALPLPLLQEAAAEGGERLHRVQERYVTLLRLVEARLRVLQRLAEAPSPAPLESEELDVPAVGGPER